MSKFTVVTLRNDGTRVERYFTREDKAIERLNQLIKRGFNGWIEKGWK